MSSVVHPLISSPCFNEQLQTGRSWLNSVSHKLNKKLWVCGRSVRWKNKDRSEIKSVVGDGTKNVLYMP